MKHFKKLINAIACMLCISITSTSSATYVANVIKTELQNSTRSDAVTAYVKHRINHLCINGTCYDLQKELSELIRLQDFVDQFDHFDSDIFDLIQLALERIRTRLNRAQKQ
jgi:hypothetical protein